MRVLVTGGAGFIGANLCRRLTGTEGVERITVLDDLSTGSRDNLDGLDVELRVGSILDTDTMSDCAAGDGRHRPPRRPPFGAAQHRRPDG